MKRSLQVLPTRFVSKKHADPRRGLVEKLGYGPNWPSQRRKALERDRYTCQRCGRVGKKIGWRWSVHVHHISKIREFARISGGVVDYETANDLSNLVTLCPTCHKVADRHMPLRGFEMLR